MILSRKNEFLALASDTEHDPSCTELQLLTADTVKPSFSYSTFHLFKVLLSSSLACRDSKLYYFKKYVRGKVASFFSPLVSIFP